MWRCVCVYEITIFSCWLELLEKESAVLLSDGYPQYLKRFQILWRIADQTAPSPKPGLTPPSYLSLRLES